MKWFIKVLNELLNAYREQVWLYVRGFRTFATMPLIGESSLPRKYGIRWMVFWMGAGKAGCCGILAFATPGKP
jgi:hypothetical protein